MSRRSCHHQKRRFKPAYLLEPWTVEGGGSEHLDASSEHYSSDSEHSESEQTEKLLTLAAPVREKSNVAKGLVEKTILTLCSEDWRSLRTLAGLLGRDPDSLRNHYINPMLRDGRLVARVPGNPNHPNQAYMKKPE